MSKTKRSFDTDKFKHTIVGQDEIDDATFEKMASSMQANNNDESASEDEAGSLSVSDLIALGRAKKAHLKRSSTSTAGLPAKRRVTPTSSATNIRKPKTNKVCRRAHDKEWVDGENRTKRVLKNEAHSPPPAPSKCDFYFTGYP